MRAYYSSCLQTLYAEEIYRLFLLKTGPHLYRAHGIGSISTDTKPKIEVAHAMPSLWYTAYEYISMDTAIEFILRTYSAT
jgi:hypothetical protein